MNSNQIIERMLCLAHQFAVDGMDMKAFELYKQIVELEPNTTAQYNLGCLYALGKGTERNFLLSAYWFNKAYGNGDEKSKSLLLKSTLDYMMDGADSKTPKALFDEMLTYAECLYPDANAAEIADEKLFECAMYNFGKKNSLLAAKFFRSAAEFTNNGNAQYNLGLFYNTGTGVERNDIVSMYWFDKAADNGIDKALTDRNGILNAYYNNLSRDDFVENMNILITCCRSGCDDEIPEDVKKADFWQKIKNKYVN